MSKDWEGPLERWTSAGLLDADSAGRIRAWEGERSRSQGLSWPIRIALALGAILLAAGVLLFVSAHWDELSPAGRMSLLVATVALLHAGGVAAHRFEGLAMALHAVGTIALGAAIALAGQIFNLNEHWPTAVLMWAAGAAIAWALLGHWTQGALCAILLPYWLAGEWDAYLPAGGASSMLPVWAGVCALSFAYLSARRASKDSALRKALGWLGGLALLPAAATVAAFADWHQGEIAGGWQYWIAWTIAVLGPLGVAVLLKGREAVWDGAAIVWTVLLAMVAREQGAHIVLYGWCAVGAVGLAAWGVRDARAERINLGIAGFAITVMAFYFSDLMDKLGRSASLMGLGLLFLGGGWLLERMRRRLMARITGEAL